MILIRSANKCIVIVVVLVIVIVVVLLAFETAQKVCKKNRYKFKQKVYPLLYF